MKKPVKMLYEVINEKNHHLVKSWTKGVIFDENAKKQVLNIEIAKMNYTHLTREERYQIYALKKAGHTQSEIATSH